MDEDILEREDGPFSERRAELWPNFSREFWQLHEHGLNWADATEGSPAYAHVSGTNGRATVSLERHKIRTCGSPVEPGP
jgi:hypothetical protein